MRMIVQQFARDVIPDSRQIARAASTSRGSLLRTGSSLAQALNQNQGADQVHELIHDKYVATRRNRDTLKKKQRVNPEPETLQNELSRYKYCLQKAYVLLLGQSGCQ